MERTFNTGVEAFDRLKGPAEAYGHGMPELLSKIAEIYAKDSRDEHTRALEEIAAFCKSEGVKLGVGFMMRFHAYHQKMRELVQGCKIGEVVSVRSQFTCWYPEMENCWRQDKTLSGGGALMDM